MEPAAGPDHLSSCPNKLAAGARSGPVFTTAAVSGGGGEGGGGSLSCHGSKSSLYRENKLWYLT